MQVDFMNKQLRVWTLIFVLSLVTIIFASDVLGACLVPTNNLTINISSVLCNGTYYVNDIDDNGLLLINSNNIILEGNNTIIIGNRTGNGIQDYNFRRTNITLKGFTIMNYTRGIEWSTPNASKLLNMNVSGNGYNIYIYHNSKVACGVFPNFLINNSVFDNSYSSSSASIYLENGANMELQNVRSRNNQGRGLYLIQSACSIVNNSIVTNNSLGLSAGVNAWFSVGSDNALVENTDFSYSNYNNADDSCLNPIVNNSIFRNNTLNYCGHFGINLCQNYVINNNTFDSNYLYDSSIYLCVGTNNRIINNNVQSPGDEEDADLRGGITIENGNGYNVYSNNISNNIINNSLTACLISGSYGNIWTNNTLSNCTGSEVRVYNGGASITTRNTDSFINNNYLSGVARYIRNNVGAFNITVNETSTVNHSFQIPIQTGSTINLLFDFNGRKDLRLDNATVYVGGLVAPNNDVKNGSTIVAYDVSTYSTLIRSGEVWTLGDFLTIPTPTSSIISPSPNSTWGSVVNVSAKGTAFNNSNVGRFYINGVLNRTNSSIANNTLWNFNVSFATGNTYVAEFEFCDTFGTCANTTTVNSFNVVIPNPITVTSPTSGSNVNQFLDVEWSDMNSGFTKFYNVYLSDGTFLGNYSSNWSLINEGTNTFTNPYNAFDGNVVTYANSSTTTSLYSVLGKYFAGGLYVNDITINASVFQGGGATSWGINLEAFNSTNWVSINGVAGSGSGGSLDNTYAIDDVIYGVRVRLNGTGNRNWVGAVYDLSYDYEPFSLLNLDMYSLNIPIGSYDVNVSAYNFTNNLVASGISGTFNLISNALLNVSVYNGSSLIGSFTADLSDGQTEAGSSSVAFDVIKDRYYNVTIDSSAYALNTSQVYIANFGTNYLNVSLLPNNGVNITIRSEADGSIIYGTTALSFVGDNGNIFYSSMNGSKVFTSLTPDDYSVAFVLSPYSSKSYRLILEDRTFNYLTAYLNNGTAILFNFKTVGGSAISGVTFEVYTIINGQSTLVESVVSDLSGQVQVYLESNKYYSFVATKSGYATYYFSLNPVLYTSYDVVMTASGTGDTTTPSAVVTFSPTSFFRYQNGHYSVDFISQYDSLSSYGFNLTLPSGSIAGTGTNPHGESFTNAFNIGNSLPNQRVSLFYYYILDDGSYVNQTLSFPIIYTTSNRTWVNMGNSINASTGLDETTGYYVGERVIIVTFISLVMFGVGWLAFGGAIPGLLMALIPILFFVNVGFVPKPLYYIVGFFIVIFIISRGADT